MLRLMMIHIPKEFGIKFITYKNNSWNSRTGTISAVMGRAQGKWWCDDLVLTLDKRWVWSESFFLCPGFVWFEVPVGTKRTNGFKESLLACLYMGQKGRRKVWGFEAVSGQRSKMESDLLLQFTPMFDWWWKCAMSHSIEFEFV